MTDLVSTSKYNNKKRLSIIEIFHIQIDDIVFYVDKYVIKVCLQNCHMNKHIELGRFPNVLFNIGQTGRSCCLLTFIYAMSRQYDYWKDKHQYSEIVF